MSYARALDNSRLICKLIRSKPQLYDPENADYSNRPLHSKIWKELAKKMGVEVEEFRSKWASMRNSYARCVKAKIEHPNRTRVKWYLEDHMNFLEKHILHRSKRRNFLENLGNSSIDDFKFELENSISKNDTRMSRDDIDNDDTRSTGEERRLNGNNVTTKHNHQRLDELDEIFSNCDPQKHSETSSKSKRLKLGSITPEFERLVSSVTGFFESQTSQLKQNTDDLFFQSIEKDYEKLSEKKKRKFKLTVLNALNDLLDEAE